MELDFKRDSLEKLSEDLFSSILKNQSGFVTEEDLKICFEKNLSPILAELNINSLPRYERLGKEAAMIFKGRPDAVHGQVIIEYEKPFSFSSPSIIKHAHKQLTDYIIAEATANNDCLFIYDPKYIGVGIDGNAIFFTKFYGDKTSPKSGLKHEDFIVDGPYPFNAYTARTLLTYLRSLARKPLRPEFLAHSFGPQSQIASKVVSAFVDAMQNWGNGRVSMFFNEWQRLFGMVYGEQFTNHDQYGVDSLSVLYHVKNSVSFQQLLFCVHSYFALLMKIIAADLLTMRENGLTMSFSSKLAHAKRDDLNYLINEIENGGIYAKRGITNFLEGDFFRWYLEAFSPSVEDSIREMCRGLSEFEPATASLSPESTRDLLKKLYQYLVPQQVRHKLGEYYTPDWLAELAINESGFNGDSRKRFLDPACGSGTFLVLAIKKIKDRRLSTKELNVEVVKRIAANVWGFDLNPLAVIAARTNYLFALGELLEEIPQLEIPVYLADSVLTPTRTSGNLFGEYLEVKTSLKTFQIPAIWVKDKGFLLAKAAPLIEEMVKQNYSEKEAMDKFKKEGLIFPTHETIVQNFYSDMLSLHKDGKNGIWVRFLKNAFAPAIAGKFDYVIGNPPWIRWGYLSQEYRNATLHLWKEYGLFSLSGQAARLGGGEKDFSMLFTYTASDYYLNIGSKLCFIITQEVFKSKGAGEGFRKFKLGDKQFLRVLKAHDFIEVQPFEGAANKTAIIILEKGKETTYPVPYIKWQRKKGVGKIPTDLSYKEAFYLLQKKTLIAQPITNKNGSWQTLGKDQLDLNLLQGVNPYKARLGARVECSGPQKLDRYLR